MEKGVLLEAKVLNRKNNCYGLKPYVGRWQVAVSEVLGSSWTGENPEAIKELYVRGEHDRVVENSLKRLQHFKNVDDLENMTEADLANFYYLGKAYEQLGDVDSAISCLHIVASQVKFVHDMMYIFPGFVDMALAALRGLAKKHGEDCIMQNDPVRFLKRAFGGSPGFVKYLKRHPYRVLIPGGLIWILLFILAFRLLGFMHSSCQQELGWFAPTPGTSQVEHIQDELNAIKKELQQRDRYKCCVEPACDWCLTRSSFCACYNNLLAGKEVCPDCDFDWYHVVPGITAGDVKWNLSHEHHTHE